MSMIQAFADVCAGLRILANRPSRLGFSVPALRILAPAFALMVFLSPNYAQLELADFSEGSIDAMRRLEDGSGCYLIRPSL
jgi:hypothetical protein